MSGINFRYEVPCLDCTSGVTPDVEVINNGDCVSCVHVEDSDTIDFQGTGSACEPLSAHVKISEISGNIIQAFDDGVYASGDTGVEISSVSGNTIQLLSDGLYSSGATDTNIYNSDGTLNDSREVDMDNHSIQWLNNGLFRIANVNLTGNTGFIQDFSDQGIDFLHYAGDIQIQSYKSLQNGIFEKISDSGDEVFTSLLMLPDKLSFSAELLNTQRVNFDLFPDNFSVYYADNINSLSSSFQLNSHIPQITQFVPDVFSGAGNISNVIQADFSGLIDIRNVTFISPNNFDHGIRIGNISGTQQVYISSKLNALEDKFLSLSQTGVTIADRVTLTGGTVTTAIPLLQMTQTWNQAATLMTAIDLNVTNTASAATSNLINLRVGGTSQFKVDSAGAALASTAMYVGATNGTGMLLGASTRLFFRRASTTVWALDGTNLYGSSSQQFGWLAAASFTGSPDTKLNRGGIGIIEQKNLTAAQEYRIYKTETNPEFASFGFLNNTNVFTIETEKSGAGVIRPIALMGGKVGIGLTTPSAFLQVKAGTATVNEAPFKFTVSGAVLNTTAEVGAMEVNSSGKLFYSPINSDRRPISQGGRNLQSGTSYVVIAGDMGKIIGLSNTAARTITLPAANTFIEGEIIWFKDEAGTSGIGNITINSAGADTIDGGTSTVINQNFDTKGLYSDGVSAWFVV